MTAAAFRAKGFLTSPIEWGSSDSYGCWLAFDSAASIVGSPCVPGIWYEAAVDLQLPLSYMPAYYVHRSLPFHVAL